MLPDTTPCAPIRRIAGKEITLFFASPIAYLFLAAFAAVTLFVFFWGESFFARNIADVRPLFEWMPLLLIFLASTLTMRLWSEERRSGTLEHVLTQPVALWHFVAGKFIACLALLAIALLITLPLPITVSLIGDLDWGPVWAGYLATWLLGGAYLSIGLFVSARSDNQIVSLISAVALCAVFYLIGAPAITDFFGDRVGEWLRLLGTGSRFDAITRGVIDLRDLYYYVSIIVVFLALNTYMLERERWAQRSRSPRHRGWHIVTALLLGNALAANLWLAQVNALRVDVTRGQQYSISSATRNTLAQLREPLLLRGYFSAKTHPLLAPLAPQLRDLMKEYEIAGRGKVKVEFIDPLRHPELEEEANQKYGIKPVPFQVADRYQSSIVSSYFNVLVHYGDQQQVLGFQELIEVKAASQTDIDVKLRNPEFDLTRAIKKALTAYQTEGDLFDTVEDKITFNAFISADETLPETLRVYKETLLESLQRFQDQSQGRLAVNVFDPNADGGQLAEELAEAYGFRPMASSLMSEERFYFYLTIARGAQVLQIPLEDLTLASFERNFEAAVRRTASGFTKTVALVLPPAPAPNPYGLGAGGGARFNQLQNFLGEEINVLSETLESGQVSGEADILMLIAPDQLDDKQLFAVDQFLMQGGAVVVATGPYAADFSNRTMALAPRDSGLQEWLGHHGLGIGDSIVLDPMNAAFPIPINRDIGGFQVQDLRMLDYPYFVDARADGLNQDYAITADIPQATLTWASPISVDPERQGGRELVELAHSSAGSWLSTSLDIMPRIDANGLSGFAPQGPQARHLLAVSSSGRFDSYFAGRPSPRLVDSVVDQAMDDALGENGEQAGDAPVTPVTSVIERSAESARIILFASNDFLRDEIVQLLGSSTGSEYLNTLQLMANAIDWSLEDASLMSIRARSHFNQTLPPMEHEQQLFWEYLNYALGALALGAVALLQRRRKLTRQRRYRQLLSTQA